MINQSEYQNSVELQWCTNNLKFTLLTVALGNGGFEPSKQQSLVDWRYAIIIKPSKYKPKFLNFTPFSLTT